MTRPPRLPNEPVLTRQLIVRICTVGTLLCAAAFGFFEMALQSGRSLEVARTIAVNVFVFGELFYLFNCRSLSNSIFKIGIFGNKILLAGVLAMALLQILFTYMPFMNTAIHSKPILPADWAFVLGTGLVIFLVMELEKKIQFDIKIKSR